ncbi:MAG: glycosyltransferase family 4 protein [Deltaproteobacteria bacterium]|nr:glycosyltransferase family 4 protein [Deltaproteobacteria bacterium]
MRILHCLSQIPGKTGSGVYLQAIVREAASAGHRQAVVCGLPQGMKIADCGLDLPAADIFPVRFETPQLPFPVAGMSDVMPYPSTCFSSFDAQRLKLYEKAFTEVLELAVSRFEPEIIHTHHLWLMTALCRKLFPGIPIVTSVHGTELRQLDLAPQLADRVIEGVAAVDQVMVLNRDQQAKVVRIFGFGQNQVTVVGTGYRRDLFCNTCCAKEKIPTLIYAGKLSRAKGVPWLLEAFAELEGDLRLWLVGSGAGPEAEAIRRQAAADPRVECKGAVSQSELAELFKKAHLMVLPSFFEGLPLVLLEALACDCRIVTTRLAGIEELLEREAIDSSVISLVPLPALEGPDQPRPEAETDFRNDLRKALIFQLEKIRKEQFNCSLGLNRILTRAGWPEIFKRIEAIYARCRKRGSTQGEAAVKRG